MRLLLILVFISMGLLSQAQYQQTKPKKYRVNDHRTNISYNKFVIDTLRIAINDGRLEKAATNQGVIGNDFYSDFEIGKAQADNDRPGVPCTPTDYQPIDGFKRTLTGELIQWRFSDYAVDDDLNFIIKVDSNSLLLKTHKANISNRKIKKNISPYRNWNSVFGEIDIFDDWHKYYKSPYAMPVAGRDSVSLYGPWVIEVYDEDECGGSHDEFHEIHPAEQVWWVTKSSNVKKYNFILANDASKRFNDRGDFTEWGTTKLKNFWVNTPLNGIFAIPFKINPSSEQISYKINYIAESGIKQTVNEPRRHYLIYNRDTLVKIEEVEKKCVTIDFENVGLDPQSIWKDEKTGIISGFLLLKSTIYREEGNMKLEVIETRKPKGSQINKGVKGNQIIK